MLLLLSALFLLGTAQSSTAAEIQRHDFFVTGDSGVRLFVREVSTRDARNASRPLVLVHGARVPGIASFDLPVPGGSLAADLARNGFDIFILDVRGYGRSTRPREMELAPEDSPPLVRSNVAVRDIGAVVDWIRQHRNVPQVALFGWAVGGQWAGDYTSLYSEKVSALILLNSLYRGDSKHPLMGHGSDMEDPAHAGHFNRAACGGYRLNNAQSLLGAWDRSIPNTDKNSLRDNAVAEAYVAAALASDPTSGTRTPASFRSPCGALEDSFYLATGHQLWDASLIVAPVLILASENDFWSRVEDRINLAVDLKHSTKVKTVVLPGATHFVHLDRPERGRTLLLQEVTGFLEH